MPNVYERHGGRSPGSFSIGTENSSGSHVYTIAADELDEWMRANLESATPMGGDDPRIRRTLPAAHPQYPWMFLDGVNGQGIQFLQAKDSDPDGMLEAPPIPRTAEYNEYHLNAGFSTRPYAVLSDGQIPIASVTWTKEDGTTQTVRYAKEYYRYVEWEMEPAAEYLTAQRGQFLYKPLGAPTGAASYVSVTSGQIRLLLKSRTWRLRWYKVPKSFVLSNQSRLDAAQGTVNQNSWEGFSPGHALLQSVRVLKTYSPPFPEYVYYDGLFAPSQEKLCDLELVIIEANRTAASAFTPTNANNIVGGHNLIPWANDRKFYYVETTGTGGSDLKPIYPSYPFEIMFSNPEIS